MGSAQRGGCYRRHPVPVAAACDRHHHNCRASDSSTACGRCWEAAGIAQIVKDAGLSRAEPDLAGAEAAWCHIRCFRWNAGIQGTRIPCPDGDQLPGAIALLRTGRQTDQGLPDALRPPGHERWHPQIFVLIRDPALGHRRSHLRRLGREGTLDGKPQQLMPPDLAAITCAAPKPPPRMRKL
jgi:hypothetical protein